MLEKLNFYIIVPSEATNYVRNPTPYLATTGYTYTNGTLAISSDFTRRSPACLKMTPSSGTNALVYYSGLPVTNGETVSFSVDVKGVAGQAMRVYIATGAGVAKETKQFTATGNWQRISVTHKATETKSDYRIYVQRDTVASTTPFYTDGWQFEGGEPTTFFSGDTQGFSDNDFTWHGTPHNSVSMRAKTRAGGKLLNIKDHARIKATFGLGMGDYEQIYSNLVSGGAMYQRYIRRPRNFSLMLDYVGENIDEIYANKNAIVSAVTPDDTPMVIRYQGLDDDGYEVTYPLDIICVPQPSQKNSPDIPFWQRDVLNGTALDGWLTSDIVEGGVFGDQTSYTANYLIKRDTAGSWVDGNGNNLLAGVIGGPVYAIKEAPDGDIYVCGDFTKVTNPGGDVPNTKCIARWSKVNQEWEAVGNPVTGATLLDQIFCMEFDSAGNLYVGGVFLKLAGDADANSFAKWDGANWSAMGSGINSLVWSIAISDIGEIYIGGDFTSASGDSNNKRIAKWSGSEWVPLNTGLNDTVHALKFHPNGILIIGGQFTDATGADGDYVCWWDGSDYHSFTELGAVELTGESSPRYGTVLAIDVTPDGAIVIGGHFREAGGDNNANKIAIWGGSNWQSVGGEGVVDVGSTISVNRVHCMPDGITYISGQFQHFGSFVLPTSTMVYKGGSWRLLEIDLPGIDWVGAVLLASDNSLYIGGNFYGTATAGASLNIIGKTANSAYPVITMYGPGVLQSIYNHTTNRKLQFNGLVLQPGEILTINLDPTNLTINSNWGGNRIRYLSPGSDLSSFEIKPGDNSISVLIPSGTSAATKVFLTYTLKFWNIEAARYV